MTLEPWIAVLALKTHRPVKMVFTREEEFQATTVRHPYRMRYRSGVRRDGTLAAREVQIISDCGAYVSWGASTLAKASIHAAGPYVIPHVKIDGYLVYTNNPVGGAMRGFGVPQVGFASECHTDTVAAAVGMDPIAFRLRNALAGRRTPADWPGAGAGDSGADPPAGAAARPVGVGRESALVRKRGRGIAWMAYPIGFTSYANPSAAFVKVNQDGSAVVWTGAADVGQGSTTVLAQIAADALGVHLDRITMVTSDTLHTPMDLGSVASRVTYIAGNAIVRACAQARQILLEVAAEELGIGSDGLDSRDGWIVVRDLPERRVSFADIARKAEAVKGRPAIGAGSYNPPTTFLDPETGHGKPYNTYVYATQIAEVEVDTETGQVQVLRLTAVHDCGHAINPLLVEGQIQGGMAMGMGYALSEEMVVNDGQVLNTKFADYLVPTAMDVPPMTVGLVEVPDPTGPFGAKGVGEPALLPTAPAIVNAIYDAVGVRIRELPVTAERLLAALRAQEGSRDRR